jgi:hypothetical protein
MEEGAVEPVGLGWTTIWKPRSRPGIGIMRLGWGWGMREMVRTNEER